VLSNSEELSNISANSFLFMGHVNFIMTQYQESFNMLTNGVDLADKMPDVTLKVYGTSLLKSKSFFSLKFSDISLIYLFIFRFIQLFQ
jgi:hypothetical protein